MKPMSAGKRARRMNDLIKREDAIKTLLDMPAFDCINKNRAIAKCIVTIKELPSADRPQGEWVDAEIPLESGGTMPIQVCNLCKTFYPLAYTGGGHRFCPNCGASMKGADDE